MGEPFDDPVLGPVRWNDTDGCWAFEAGPVGGRRVAGRFAPQGGTADAAGWDGVRSCVRWVRANEPAVRAHLLTRLGARTDYGGERRPTLALMLLFSGREALLMYGGCGDGEWWVRVSAEGLIVAGPFRFASLGSEDDGE